MASGDLVGARVCRCDYYGVPPRGAGILDPGAGLPINSSARAKNAMPECRDKITSTAPRTTAPTCGAIPAPFKAGPLMAKRAANGRTAGACRASQLSLPRPFPIGERLERAGQLVVRSRIFYDICFFFESAEARPVIIEVMRRFNEFFRFDPHAHFVAFVVHTAALFEKRRDTINLPSLLKEMKTANLISAQDAAEVDALLAQAKDVASKVTILRSNLFAHRSATLSYDDAFKKPSVTPNH